MAGINDDEVERFAELARDLPLEVRFIEYMPTAGRAQDAPLCVPSDQLLERLGRVFPLRSVVPETHPGPARRYTAPGWRGSLGIISPISCHFCHDCNRIRVAATGWARSCLLHDAGLDLRPWLESGDRPGLAAALRQVVAIKPQGHALRCADWRDEDGPAPFAMSSLGG
jgi:cyclic pyranopterin phosphate synthase